MKLSSKFFDLAFVKIIVGSEIANFGGASESLGRHSGNEYLENIKHCWGYRLSLFTSRRKVSSSIYTQAEQC